MNSSFSSLIILVILFFDFVLQVPQYLLDCMWARGEPCKIICTQPRRISATSGQNFLSVYLLVYFACTFWQT